MVADWYADYSVSLVRFDRVHSICGDMRIVRRASVGLTTADEIVLQSIATVAREALNGLLSIDVRGSALTDSTDYDSDIVLRQFAESGATFYMAILIADRGLGSMVQSSAFESAKDSAIGAEPVTLPLDAVIAIPPIGPRGTLESTVASLLPGADAIIVICRQSGSTMWSNYAALTTKGKFPEHGGLTRAVVDRYNTIVPGAERDGDIPPLSIVGIDGRTPLDVDAQNAMHVIETNDGVTYAAWAGGAPIDVARLQHIVGPGMADRDGAYHAIMEPVILSRAVDAGMANIARQYASDNTKYSGGVQLDAARQAVYSRIRAMPITSRSEYMMATGDRAANIEAIIAASRPAGRVTIREAIARESAVNRFIVLIERKVWIKAPTDDEFAKYDDPRRLVDIALTSTLDMAVADAKRTRVFAEVDRELADYVRIHTRNG